jgi:hypothetical protein
MDERTRKDHVQRERRSSRSGRAAWTLLAPALLAPAPDAAWSFCSTSGDGSKCHPQIVREGLHFLRPGILDAIAHHVNDPDRRDKPRFVVDQWRRANYATADHFDNCNFDEGAERINDRYFGAGAHAPGVVESLSPFRRARRIDAARLSRLIDEDTPGILGAMRQWGWILHAVQDFYSHSNWVELGFTDPSRDLVDAGLGAWAKIPPDWRLVRGDVIAAQQPMPSGWRMEFSSLEGRAGRLNAIAAGVEPQPHDARSPRHVPHVVRPGAEQQRLLISGHGPVPNPWNSCPLAKLVLHDELNKDRRTRAGNPEALTMAIAQTRHEWCRLLALTHASGGVEAAAVPMGLMVSPGRSPHPAGTACAPAPAGEIEVVARVTGIQVRDGVQSGQGNLTLVFSGFTGDFRRSARAQSHGIAVGPGDEVPAGSHPAPLRFCLNPDERLVLTVQGWENRGASSRAGLDGGDALLAGATIRTPGAGQLASGAQPLLVRAASDNARRRDLEVGFEIFATSSANCRKSTDPRAHEPEYMH